MSLPILSRRFFTENPPNVEFYSTWKKSYAWSNKILPLYQWQGILYVGCLDMPKNPPQVGFQLVYVLCDPESLATTWETYTAFEKPKASLPNAGLEAPKFTAPKAKEPAVAAKKDAEFPLGIEDKTHPKIVQQDDNDFFAAIEKTTVAAVAESKSESGFDQIAKEFNIDLSSPSEESVVASEESQVAAPEEDSEKTTPLAEEHSDEATSPLEGINLEHTKPSLSALAPLSKKDQPAEDQDEVTKTSLTASSVEQKPVAAKPTLVTEKRSTPVSTEVLYTKPGALSANKKASPAPAEASQASIRIQTPVQADGFISEQFKELSYHYSKSMVLLKTKGSISPWKWDEKFEVGSDKQASYSLTTPSPFRIVDKTQKSFHGYVVANDLNEKFFEEWNQSHIPEHLTISPIIVEDEVVGMVLGIGNKDADNKTSLQLTEKVAANFSKQMQRQPQFFKAA